MVNINDNIYIDTASNISDVFELNESNDNVLFSSPVLKKWMLIDESTGEVLKRLLERNISVKALINELCIENKDIDEKDIEDSVLQLLNYLYDEKILFTSKTEYENVKEENLKLKKFTPKSIYLEITSNCNIRCKHCFGEFGECAASELSSDKIDSLLEQAKLLNVQTIILSGGKPLLHIDFIPICLNILKKGFNLSLTTNGTIFNEDMFQLFKDWENIDIQFSLEGLDKETHELLRGENTFDRTIKNINKFIDEGFAEKVSISTTVFKGNVNKIDEILQWCTKNKIRKISFKKMISLGRATPNWDKIAICDGYEFFSSSLRDITDKYRDNLLIDGCPNEKNFSLNGIIDLNHPCQMGENIRIDSTGNAYPCQLLGDDKFCIGNIFEDALREIYYGSKLKNLFNIAKDRMTKIGKCSKCTFLWWWLYGSIL